MSSALHDPSGASRALLSAALGGLLCVSCSSTSEPATQSVPDTSVAADSSVTDSAKIDTAVDTSVAEASADTTVPDAAPDTVTDARPEVSCIGEPDAGPDAAETGKGVITKSVVDPTMTLDTFTAMCNERGGTIEIHPHCGGSNSCKGMSYDSGTQTYTEHTCKALNTCTGYSCVLGC